MAATATEKPQEPRRDVDGELRWVFPASSPSVPSLLPNISSHSPPRSPPSGAPAVGLDPGPGSCDAALTPEPTEMPAVVAESSSVRRLGRLFRLTEVHLW